MKQFNTTEILWFTAGYQNFKRPRYVCSSELDLHREIIRETKLQMMNYFWAITWKARKDRTGRLSEEGRGN